MLPCLTGKSRKPHDHPTETSQAVSVALEVGTSSQTNQSWKSQHILGYSESSLPTPARPYILLPAIINQEPLWKAGSTMGPAVLFFLVLAVAAPLVLAAKTHNSTSTWGYNSTAKPSTVWINNYETECVLFRELRADYDFEFGTSAWFFCSNFNTSPCNEFLFGVFFGDRLVWSANRDHPVRENATLEFTSDGNLVLRDADGSQVWSSNSSGRSVAGMVITEIGNLVLFDQRNATVWQSSDHPTDTLLPGQSLLEGKRLTASTSPTNTTKGQFYITVHQDGLYAYVESTPPQPYFEHKTNLAKIGNDPVKVTFTNGSLNIVVRPDINDSISLLPEAKSAQVMSIDSDGHLRLYELSGTEWTIVYDVMNIDDCDYPTVCGEYGICTEGQCTCPLQKNSISSYFKLVDEWKPNLGCAPIIPISCQETQHHKLLTLPHISYFAQSDMVWNATSIDDCKQLCLKNCSCMAVLVRYEVCEWITKVFSLQSKQPDTVGYSVYLKVQVSPSNKNKKKVMLGATLGTITALVLLVIVVALYLQKRKKYEEKDEFYFDQFPGMPTRFSFEKLSECTEGFIKKLGEGGFGSVFEGKLGEERVAVKRLEGARQGKKEFLAEVETIGSIEHINLVSLIGFCAEKTERLLVYEYMSRGSLDRWIYYRHNNGPLDWCTRSRIILDIAKGLCYLHEQCKSKIAHLDIKPQNILLDDNFNAKVADFGLCKLINRDQSKVVTVMRGTPGYLAPEWLTSRITEKVDVYSFGVVLMEIVSGRKNIDHARPEEEVQLINVLQEKAQNDQLVDLIDKHSDDMVSHQEEVIEMMKLAIWCLQNDSIQRPSMSVVIKVLEGSMSVQTIDANSVMPVQHNASTCSVPPQASVLSGPR